MTDRMSQGKSFRRDGILVLSGGVIDIEEPGEGDGL